MSVEETSLHTPLSQITNLTLNDKMNYDWNTSHRRDKSACVIFTVSKTPFTQTFP